MIFTAIDNPRINVGSILLKKIYQKEKVLE